MDAIIRVRPATATATVTEVVASTNIVETLNVELSIFDMASLILLTVSLGGCSITAVPNPNLLERGEKAAALY